LKRRAICRIAPSMIRFQRSQPTARVVVYYKGERMGEPDAQCHRQRRKPSTILPHPDKRSTLNQRMIRFPFWPPTNPLTLDAITLLAQQQEVFDILRVHAQQGGLCLVLGEPGTGTKASSNNPS